MQTILVLNLKRRPDRRETFLRWNNREDLKIEWVEAVDGMELQRPDLIQKGVVSEHSIHFTAGNIGCGYSHKLLWERAVNENRPLIVCEDDAILRGDFVPESKRVMEQLPADWDFVTFGYNFDSVLDVELFPGQQLRGVFSKCPLSEAELQAFVQTTRSAICLPLANAFGLCAYAISPKGAERFLQLCFPMKGNMVGVPALGKYLAPTSNIDEIMNGFYCQTSSFAVVPPLAVSPHNLDVSDTLNSPRLDR